MPETQDGKSGDVITIAPDAPLPTSTRKGGAGPVGYLNLESVQRLIENAVAQGQSGGTYGSSSGSSYGSSLYPNSKNMKKRKSRSRRR